MSISLFDGSIKSEWQKFRKRAFARCAARRSGGMVKEA